MLIQVAILGFIGNILANTVSRITSVVAGRAIDRSLVKKNSSNLSANTKDSQITQKLLRAIQANQSRMADLKVDELAIMETRLHMEKAIAIDESEDRKKALSLTKRSQDIQLAIASAEAEDRALFRDLLHNQKVEDIQLRLKEVQSHWDEKNLSTILSRQEIQNILVDGQRRYQLLMLCSSPDIASDDESLSSFRLYFEKDLRGGLIRFLEKNYPLEKDNCPVEFYGKFFTKSVFDLQVKQQLRSILSPIPTAVLYSDITDHEFSLYIAIWGYSDIQFSPIAVDPINWLAIKTELMEGGMDEQNSLRIIRQLFVMIHKLFAAFLADIYYLSIDIFYEPQLFHLSDDFLQEWFPSELIEHCTSCLKDLQYQQLRAYEDQLIDIERQLNQDKQSSLTELMQDVEEMKSRIKQKRSGN